MVVLNEMIRIVAATDRKKMIKNMPRGLLKARLHVRPELILLRAP
jgi:hypothetical protein